jgi:hypothetical protein
MAIGTRGGIQKSLNESNADYMNDLVDTAVIQGQGNANTSAISASGGQHLSGQLSSNYLDFATGYLGRLAGEVSKSITDAQVDAGGAAGGTSVAAIGAATLSGSTINDILFIADAAGRVFLPTATADTHLAVQITGDMDAANALTFQTSMSAAVGESTNDAVFAKQVIGPEMGDGSATAQTVVTAGLPNVPVSKRLIYTPAAAATNFLSVGSIVHFYCPIDNQWLVKVRNVKEGSGATGTFTVGA